VAESNDETVDYNDWTVSDLDEEITERNKEYGPAGGTTLPLSGLKADKVAALESDDARLERLASGEDSDVTANQVHDLADEAKTGAVRRREANDERKAGEYERWQQLEAEKQAESATPQQHGVAADIAEKQAAEREGTTEGTTERTAETETEEGE
jgi:hypothetical protein